MNWFTVLEIVARVASGVIVVGFFIGLFLCNKHPVFEKMLLNSGFVVTFTGATYLFVYTILGRIL